MPFQAACTRLFILIGSLIISHLSLAQSIGGCDNYIPTEGQTVTCSANVTPAATSGVQTATTTSNNNITVNVLTGTTLSINGAPIGIGSGAIVNNYGILNSRSFFNGYGMSSGANRRSQAGGSTLNNFSSGQIITGGEGSDGMYIVASNAGSRGNTIFNAGTVQTSGPNAMGVHINSGATSSTTQNTITNNGSITTTGLSSYGIRLQSAQAMGSIINSGTITTSGLNADGISVRNTGNIISINNSGTITAQGDARGIAVNGAAAITNSGTISTNGTAIYFENGLNNREANSVTILAGSSILGGIRFNPNGLQEKLIFDGYTNDNFNNLITGLNIIEVTNNANVILNNSSGLSTGNSTINIASGSRMEIKSTLSDKTDIDPSIQTAVNKLGDGVLVLSGANTYSGNTTLTAGTLALANNQALGTGTLTMQNGTTLQANTTLNIINPVSLNGSTTVNTNDQKLTLAGLITGAGGLNKTGGNTLTIDGANTYSGNTTLSNGTLILNGSITSNTTIQSGTILQGGGTVFSSVNNMGMIQPNTTDKPTNLTINGNYTSNGGVFATTLHGTTTNIIADTLTIQGAGSVASGSTQIGLINTQLLGNPTTGDGILLINATGGAVTGNTSFYYPNRIAAGAYEYQIVKGGTNSPNSWYLRADNSASLEIAAAYGTKPLVEYKPAPQPAEQAEQAIPQVVIPNVAPVPTTVTPEPSQRIEVANYPSIASLARLYALSTVDSFDQRRSDLAQANGSLGIKTSKTSWGRVLGKSAELRSQDRNMGPGVNGRTFAIQLGTDLYSNESPDGAKTFFGPFMTLGQASGNTYNSNGNFNTGNVLLQGYTLGLNATHITAQGFYVDALLQATRFSGVRANSILGASINTTGWGLSASIESGMKIKMTDQINLTPQAQLIYNNTQMNDTADFYANIGIPNDSSLTGRIGLKLSYDNLTPTGSASQAWIRLSGLSTLTGRNSQIVFQSPNGNSNVAFNAQTPANWLSLDAGLNVALSKTSQLSFTLGYDTSVTNAYRGGYGQVGLQVAF